MFRRHREIIAPINPVIDIGTVKRHLRVDHDDDDLLIAGYLSAAVAWIEAYLDRALITRTLRVVYTPRDDEPFLPTSNNLQWGWSSVQPLRWRPDDYRRALELPLAPCQSVETVTLTTPSGASLTILPADYRLDLDAEPARITVYERQPDHTVTLDAVVGYGDTPDAIPAPIRSAVMLMTANLYEHRGDGTAETPSAIAHLLAPYRLYRFGA